MLHNYVDIHEHLYTCNSYILDLQEVTLSSNMDASEAEHLSSKAAFSPITSVYKSKSDKKLGGGQE